MTKNITALLLKPFPESKSYKSYVLGVAMISIFVMLFLFVLRPFNLDRAPYSIFIYTAAYGGITFITTIVFDAILRFIFKIRKEGESYTLLSWIIQTTLLISIIAFFNYLYTNLSFGMSWSNFPQMMLSTYIVGIFPLVFVGTISMLRKEKRNINLATQINENRIKPPQAKEYNISLFDIRITQIIYIESLQNYVTIYHIQNGSQEKTTKRATLKSCENQLKDTSFLRCHRSYIVNKSMIKSVSGNAQGLRLDMEHTDQIIPVSRSYISLFRD